MVKYTPYNRPPVDYSQKVNADEQTGSDMIHNLTVFGATSICAVHGFVQQAGNRYSLRILNDAVATREIVKGAAIKLKDGVHLTVKVARLSECQAWVLTKCERVS